MRVLAHSIDIKKKITLRSKKCGNLDKKIVQRLII